MISILTIKDGRNIFSYIFPDIIKENQKITELKDVLTSFIIAIGSGKEDQRDELQSITAGNYNILVEWESSLVGILFVSSDWSQDEEKEARFCMCEALREVEQVYREEIDLWLEGGGDLSLFWGVGAILGRFFRKYSLVPIGNVDNQILLQNPYNYYLKLNEDARQFLSTYLQSNGYRHFLEKHEIAGKTANAIIRELMDDFAPLRLILKTPLDSQKIIRHLLHLLTRDVLNLFHLPIERLEVYYQKLNKFLTKMKNRENLGPPANAFYTSRIGDCFYFVWTEGKDCLTSKGERTGCHGRVFREGDFCEIFLERLQIENP